MGIESAQAGFPVQTVRPLADADKDSRENHPRQNPKSRRQRDAEPEHSGPVPNEQGQLTGKVIDTTA